MVLKCSIFISFKVSLSRYIALFGTSRSIKKLFSIDSVNIYLFSIFFSISENEMDRNIKEIHGALQWGDKAEDKQESAKFKSYTKVLK